jgi:hypothetical protein
VGVGPSQKKAAPTPLKAASMQEKVATKQHGTCIDDEDLVINPQNKLHR